MNFNYLYYIQLLKILNYENKNMNFNYLYYIQLLKILNYENNILVIV